MRKSIRFKLFLYMTVSVVIFAVLLYCFNAFFIERYYTEQKKQALIQVTEKINQLISGKDKQEDFWNEDLIFALDRLSKSTGTVISIGTKDGTTYYPLPHGFPGMPQSEPSKDPPPPESIKSQEKYSNNSFFVMTIDPRLRIDALRYQVELANGLILSSWIPLAEIAESASITNQYTVMIALLTIFLTGIWALYISGRFTRPIKEMNQITKQMSELDFSQTLQIDQADEIGELSQSINHLSQRLDRAIAEVDRRNKQLEKDIDRERKLDKLRREFVSSVSHELKTPIFLIQGYAEGLKNNIAQDEEKKNFYCDVIMDETEKMDFLVKDLLDLSQMESGMFSIKKSDFDIAQLVKEIIKKYQHTFSEKSINLEIQTPDHLMVNADPVRVEQVMVNFLNNAVNHVSAKKMIRVTVKAEETKCRVLVYNSGQHIPKEYLEKIWTSFYKVDKARTRKSNGMGLGLSIVRAIQDAHHNLYGTNNVRDGVEFWFDIDLCPN